ncbi:rhomboid-like protein [Streptomyces sp. NPDC001700]
MHPLLLADPPRHPHLGDPRTVHALLTDSSTDVSHLSHLSQRPLLTLLASALWVVGGITSPYLAAFLLVLGALERRVGGLRTAGVFLLGQVLATLLTEIPVAASVAVGHLPDSSLRRLDYGVSYGLIAGSLVHFDPFTDGGHALALLAGTACWPYARHAAQRPGQVIAHSERGAGNT